MGLALLALAGCDSGSSSPRGPLNLVPVGETWQLGADVDAEPLLTGAVQLCDDPGSVTLDPGGLAALEFTAEIGHSIEIEASTVGFTPLAIGIYGPRTEDGFPRQPVALVAQGEDSAGGPAKLVTTIIADGTYAAVIGMGPASAVFPVGVSLRTDGVPGCTGDPCIGMGAPCNDDDACTADTCKPFVGCVSEPLDCEDEDLCTTVGCDPLGDGCTATPIPCDDEDLCTTDLCRPESGCDAEPIECEDGDPCTENDCDSELGCTAGPADCDDFNPCTLDQCEPLLGCVETPVECDDGNPCTFDVCTDFVGCTGNPIVCNDGDACTVDYCDNSRGCLTLPDLCDDGDPNTTDLCTPGVGCEHVPPLTEGGPVCQVSGLVGTKVICWIELVRAAPHTALPTSLRLDLAYDPAVFVPLEPVMTVPVPGASPHIVSLPLSPLASGHQATIEDEALLQSIRLDHPTEPDTAITAAHLVVGDEVAGEPELFALRGEMLQTVAGSSPLPIFIVDTEASAAGGAPLSTAVFQQRIVVSDPPGTPPGPACPLPDPCLVASTDTDMACNYAPALCGAGGEEAVCVGECLIPGSAWAPLAWSPAFDGAAATSTLALQVNEDAAPAPEAVRLAVSWDPGVVALSSHLEPEPSGTVAAFIEPPIDVANAQGFAVIELRAWPDTSAPLPISSEALYTLTFAAVDELPPREEPVAYLAVGDAPLSTNAVDTSGLPLQVELTSGNELLIGLPD